MPKDFVSPSNLGHAALAAFATLAVSACGAETASSPEQASVERASSDMVQYAPDAAAGRSVFVEKGCVLCHAVNGVGGKAAPALDAQTELDRIDPVEFAARMWRGAPAMVELQSLELGYTIWLSAEEIVNLAAFSADAAEQKKLTRDDIPEEMRDALLDQRFWEVENWDEFLEQGQEGYGEPDEELPADPN